ncbi:pseudouridine-5'-phosphate glycosidase [Tindallia magadiensis]|uniref:Pseudouridine-5'-phosphate glycosidase n=1 Tax=Tindallia magadiensis TaxID=69895 RepID=A0A1I3B2G0_9FIRM|nr:pseudouridine-5'-phosphate glycosidase [Tindallia magadiensis]SFH56497.1 pseudouridine-5'-phosphate glycosidase [Tindallia magadiensis]
MIHSEKNILNTNNWIQLSSEVENALKNAEPVVALESTIISHGMSYPENIESALTSEKKIRQQGAIPATIAVIKGQIKVGLSEEELNYLGENNNIRKASRRDLPMILASNSSGATTVATTMIGASMAGIKVFATGGIGGVHRGASETFDISADLLELAKTEVAVVCAGAKSILDIGLTLEVLETHGVPVIGYQTDAFPGFYVRDSGFGVDDRANDLAIIASAMHYKWQLGLGGGIVVANPIPKEDEMDPTLIDNAITNAVVEAEKNGIKGKEVTPYILAKLHQVTEGKSLYANKQLVYHNAHVAAKLAIEYARINNR